MNVQIFLFVALSFDLINIAANFWLASVVGHNIKQRLGWGRKIRAVK